MKQKFTFEVSSEAAGMAVFVPSTKPEELEQLVPRLEMYQVEGQHMVMSHGGAVQLVAATEADEEPLQRVYVGVCDRKAKTIRLMPAAGRQMQTLQTRLHDVAYDEGSAEGLDMGDMKQRMARNSQLVQAFGSSRRVRQLGQKAEVRTVEGNVLEREGMVASIAELATKASAEGTTASQVQAKVSAERAIPAHNAEATAAHDAYPFSLIVSRANRQHLDTAYLQRAMRDRQALLQLRSTSLHLRKVDVFVDFMLEKKHAAAEEDAAESCRWLALYTCCHKVLRVRPGTRLQNDVLLPEVEEVDEGSDEVDAFAVTLGETTLGALTRRLCLTSEAATEWVLSSFGSLVEEDGVRVFKQSSRQERLLKTTLAVAAVRCNGNTVNAEMGVAIYKSLRPMPPNEVANLFREIGCKVSAPNTASGPSLQAKLLAASGATVTLAECLPVARRRKGPRK